MVDRNGIKIIDKKTKYDPGSIDKKDFSKATTDHKPRYYRQKENNEPRTTKKL